MDSSTGNDESTTKVSRSRRSSRFSMISLPRSLMGYVGSFITTRRNSAQKSDAVSEISEQYSKKMQSTNNYRPLSSVSESISYLEINGHESANCSFEQYKINALKCGVPKLIVYFTHEIEKRGLNTVGVYRMSSSDKDTKMLKKKLRKSVNDVPNLSDVNVHVLCSHLKYYIRQETPDLIPENHFIKLIDVVNSCTEVPKSFSMILSELPFRNRSILAHLFLHLQKIANSPKCSMGNNNLAIIFGPAFTYISSNTLDEMHIKSGLVFKVVTELLKLPESLWTSFLIPESAPTEEQEPKEKENSSGFLNAVKRRVFKRFAVFNYWQK